MLHLNSEAKMRGRVFGIMAMSVNLAMFLPSLFIGGLADLTTPLVAMATVVVLLVFYSFYLYFEKPLVLVEKVA